MTEKADCPECEAEVRVEDPERGNIVDCEECGASLEIMATNPLELELQEEDDDDDDEDDY